MNNSEPQNTAGLSDLKKKERFYPAHQNIADKMSLALSKAREHDSESSPEGGHGHDGLGDAMLNEELATDWLELVESSAPSLNQTLTGISDEVSQSNDLFAEPRNSAIAQNSQTVNKQHRVRYGVLLICLIILCVWFYPSIVGVNTKPLKPIGVTDNLSGDRAHLSDSPVMSEPSDLTESHERLEMATAGTVEAESEISDGNNEADSVLALAPQSMVEPDKQLGLVVDAPGSQNSDLSQQPDIPVPTEHNRSSEISDIPDSIITAVQQSDTVLVKRLIATGVLVDSTDEFGNTALMLAVEKGDLEVAKLLIAAGSDVNLGNQYGDIALILAVWNGNLDILGKLIAQGADVNAKNDQGQTALISASNQGNVEMVKLLINADARPSQKTLNGKTALMSAAGNGHTAVVQVLINNGFDVNALSKEGWNALMFSALGGYAEVIKLLINNGADRNAKNSDGQTATTIASRNGYWPIVRLLASSE